MIELSNTVISNCVLHQVGNKTKAEGFKLSNEPLALDEDMQALLGQYFLKPFKQSVEAYEFSHEVDLNMNAVFVLCNNIFMGEDFLENAQSLGKHLFHQTKHPAIKSGEMFVELLRDIKLGEKTCNGIGLFKSERKDAFFKLMETTNGFDFWADLGINQQKLDKGCLIINAGDEGGLIAFPYEHGGADTDYWRNDFLSIKPTEDSFFQTKNFMALAKEFVTDKLPVEFEVTKTDQIDLLNKSVEYFKSNEEFSAKNFARDVLSEPGIIKSFNRFREDSQNTAGLDLPDEFDISPLAVKRQAKIFKSVLKLDKNFHVYIHGDRELIEKGFDDDKRMNYYKIYFKDES